MAPCELFLVLSALVEGIGLISLCGRGRTELQPLDCRQRRGCCMAAVAAGWLPLSCFSGQLGDQGWINNCFC